MATSKTPTTTTSNKQTIMKYASACLVYFELRELRYNDVWAYTAQHTSFQINILFKITAAPAAYDMKCALIVGKCFTFQWGGGQNQPTTTADMTFDEAARDTWKYEISFRRKLLRASVSACLSSVNSLEQSARFSLSLAFRVSLRGSHSWVLYDRTTFEISMCVRGAVHCMPIQLACLHMCIFLYRFDTFHFCYFLGYGCFNLSISAGVWYDTHLHLLVNQYKAHIFQRVKINLLPFIYVKQEQR